MISASVAGLLLIVAGCWVPSVYATDWPTYQHDLEHTGRSSAVIDAAKLMLSWSAPEGYAVPQIVGDTIYSTKSQGGYSGSKDSGEDWATYFTAFDLQTGAIKWCHSGNYIFATAGAVGGGFVVFHGGMTCEGCVNPTPAAGQLVVLDAATGAVRYKVPGIVNSRSGDANPVMMPLLVPNRADGTVMAYLASPDWVRGIRLGPQGGSIVWKSRAQFGGGSIPTLVGSSVVVGFEAFDQATGAVNHFEDSAPAGGGTTVAYDSERRHVYVLETAGQPGTPGINQALTAYRYVSNGKIEFLWQRVGEGIGIGSVAIGPTGDVYVAGNYSSGPDGTVLLELNPDTGATLRSLPGPFYEIQTPAITAGLLWADLGRQTVVYDLATMQQVRLFPGGYGGSRYPAPGAFADGYYVMTHGDYVFSSGFEVWAKPTARPVNISTRVRVQTNGTEVIGGFIISGSDPKQVVIRALGPTLRQAGISGTLLDPKIELHDARGLIRTNDNWKDTQESEIQASGLAPLHDSEAAMIVTLDPGAYTAVVRDAKGGAGIGLVEVYDKGADAPVKLANISTRGFVGTGDNVMIGGFILGNEGLPALVMVRAIGPTLGQAGVDGWLADPVLELRDANGTLLRSNDNWQDTQMAAVAAAGLAPENQAEAAIVATLPPAAYTAIVTGKNGSTGIALVEIYHVR